MPFWAPARGPGKGKGKSWTLKAHHPGTLIKKVLSEVLAKQRPLLPPYCFPLFSQGKIEEADVWDPRLLQWASLRQQPFASPAREVLEIHYMEVPLFLFLSAVSKGGYYCAWREEQLKTSWCQCGWRGSPVACYLGAQQAQFNATLRWKEFINAKSAMKSTSMHWEVTILKSHVKSKLLP